MTVSALHNLDAEQALLGALLIDNAVLNELTANIGPASFYDALHGKIWHDAGSMIAKGRKVDGVTLHHALAADPAYADIGGANYLGTLLDAACPSSTANEYAKIVADLASRRALVEAAQEAIRQANEPTADLTGSTVADALSRASQSIADGAATRIGLTSAEISKAVKASMDRAARGISDRLTLNFPEIDEGLGGLFPGEYTLIAGRTSMGKSIVGLTFAKKVAMQGKGVLFFAMEMSAEALWNRLAADMAKSPVSYKDIREGSLHAHETQAVTEALDRAAELPIIVDERSGLKPSDLLAAARAWRRELAARGTPLGLIVVDYIGLMNPDGKHNGRPEAVASISRSLKEIAKLLKLPIVVLAQIGRGTEARDDKRPTLADIRDSGSLEQDADAVILIHRPHYYLEKSPPPDTDADKYQRWLDECRNEKNRMHLNFAKVRQGRVQTKIVHVEMHKSAMRSNEIGGNA